MEEAREIYWNVGHGVVRPMYAIGVVAGGFFVWGFLRRLRVYRQGKPLHRLDRLPARVRFMIGNTIAQARVLGALVPGSLHSLLFWGFGILSVGSLLVMAQADFSQPLLGMVFLKGTLYKAYSLILDVAGAAAVFMLSALFARRLISGRPLEGRGLLHALLFSILLTGFLVEGVRMAVTELPGNPALARFSPVGMAVGSALPGIGRGNLLLAHKLLWWLHFLLAMAFIAAMPFTKLRHILTVPANYLLHERRDKGAINTLDLEDEGAAEFGACSVAGLTWKDIFDADACTGCGRCEDRCPAWATGKPLSPMKLIREIGDAAFLSPESDLCALLGGDALWSCTTCRACEDGCPASVEHVNKIIEMRRNLALMRGEFPGAEVRTAVNNIEVNGNPFGLTFASRGEWAEGLPVDPAKSGKEVDVLYFAGCYASFDRRNREVARSFIGICHAAGVRVGILGRQERCCGEPLRKLGNEYLYQMLAAENIQAIKAREAKRVVTACPHCFNTLSRDYRDLGLDVPVEHHSTFLHSLIADGRLSISPSRFDFTYHDSCYLGRYKDIVAEPRAVLAAAGGRISEMERSGYGSFCCGGGGGRIMAEERIGSRISAERARMAKETGASLLVTSCPFCLTMLADGIKAEGWDADLAVKDLAEVVAERIGGYQ